MNRSKIMPILTQERYRLEELTSVFERERNSFNMNWPIEIPVRYHVAPERPGRQAGSQVG